MSNQRDAEVFAKALTNTARQIPFALSLGLNRTALDIQRRQVEHMHGIFTVRNQRFIGSPQTPHRSAVRRTQAATKSKPIVELAILPPGGQARAGILTRHERDRQRVAQSGTLAVPVAARPSEQQRVPKRFRPKELGFVRMDKGKGKHEVFRGKHRTFFIRWQGGGSATIFQRQGRGGTGRFGEFVGTRVLWALRRKTRLTPRLEFLTNAGREFQEKFPQRFAEAYEQALRTAR